MPMEAQTRLLRVLQQGEYTTVGGRTPLKTDVRIVAATNKDLGGQIAAGAFREDLFYRLNVVPIRLPALRERAGDVPDLVRHFFIIAEKEGLPRKHIDSEALARLKAYTWPGNVRELENLVRRLAALCPQETITAPIIDAELSTDPRHQIAGPMPSAGGSFAPDNLPLMIERHLTEYFGRFGEELPPDGLYDRIIRELELPLISVTLAATRGNQIKAAELLGVNRNTLRKKIRDLDIRVVRSLA